MPPLLLRSLCAILLALSYLSSPARGLPEGRTLIGYRTAEADLINAKNEVRRDEAFDDRGLFRNSIGFGIYMVPEPAGWPAQPGDWHCALTADSRKIERIDKAWIKYTWIREKDDEIELLNLIGDEERIVEYLGTLVAEPERALRFSDVGAREELQMLIPTAVVNGGDLDLWAVCFETEAELRAFSDEVVDWEAWGDIQGEPQHGYS
ncbi:uncharacterized protein L3040_004451 [Drepanopeziza brunnea f. sp. 'multigermtubi']|uniref:uncharacterized protein n=1 Tax=Drepanopeziza brunnea f. sp. 'multigermtubi' TaxID=698441 RepID=UPI0023A5889D|nr:hypothetical protein L3040_004451 [Drepanopeziza brunnea f. sp. 'multigermtubi']